MIVGRAKLRWGDTVFKVAALSFALSIIVLMGLIIWQLTRNSLPTIQAFGWKFLTGVEWDPVFKKFGALPFIYGTVVSSLLALFLAVPLSLGIAIFLAELAPSWLRTPLSFLVELLAAIPSVVYGLWGIFVLLPWVRKFLEPFLANTLGFLPLFQGPKVGIGMLSAGIILAIMILPIISAVSREVLLAVPNTQREAALALGATRWETIRAAVLPYARSGLIGAVILGLGRALGETMAATMVIGNNAQIVASLFAPADTLASRIANEFAEADPGLHLSALIELGLVLFVVTIVVNSLARLLVWRVARRPEGEIKE